TQVVPAVEGYSSLVLDYKAALTKYFPGESADYVSFEGYLAARLLAEGIKRAGPPVATENLVEALESLGNFDLGLGQTLSCGRTEHQATHKVWATQLDQNGRYQSIDLEGCRPGHAARTDSPARLNKRRGGRLTLRRQVGECFVRPPDDRVRFDAGQQRLEQCICNRKNTCHDSVHCNNEPKQNAVLTAQPFYFIGGRSKLLGNILARARLCCQVDSHGASPQITQRILVSDLNDILVEVDEHKKGHGYQREHKPPKAQQGQVHLITRDPSKLR